MEIRIIEGGNPAELQKTINELSATCRIEGVYEIKSIQLTESMGATPGTGALVVHYTALVVLDKKSVMKSTLG